MTTYERDLSTRTKVGVVTEQITLYSAFAFAGGFAGLTRFLRSKGRWGWRTVTSWVFFGALMSIAIIGLRYGSTVGVDNFWECLSYSLVVGFVQPEFAEKLEGLLKVLGSTKKDLE
jgi:hypothetical protein